MSPSGKAFYVTTPIYYVNGAPHIGHAYTTVAADALCRWHRQRGESVWLLTGTDEHGEKVLRSAADAGVSPQEWVDRLVNEDWLPMLSLLDIANDDFIRTTETRHQRRVQAFLTWLKDMGHIYSGDYEGPYCVGCEEFKLPADLVPGTGEYAGEQVCTVHGKPVELVSETNWFFRLSAFQDMLLAHYEHHPTAIAPQSAYNEVISFIRSGLQDLSISRSAFDWGIPVPWDDSQVVYVWFDALLNYATAVGLGDEPPQAGAAKFASTWPADLHLVGKDILRFHAVIWPAMLMAAKLPLPAQVFAHGWLLVGGEKMSKTKLTGISPNQLVDHFGVDAVRYHFLRAIQFGQDGSFSWEDMTARYTAELANGLGNLGSRATAMVTKYFDGVLPEPGAFANADLALADDLLRAVQDADGAYQRLDFTAGIGAVKGFVDEVNLYVTEQAPWALAKRTDDPGARERLATVLYVTCEALRAIAVLHHAVMPRAMGTLWESIGAQEGLGPITEQRIDAVHSWGQLPAGVRVTKGAALFPRLSEDEPAGG